jgi:hypothetical protein
VTGKASTTLIDESQCVIERAAFPGATDLVATIHRRQRTISSGVRLQIVKHRHTVDQRQ